jgi:hypothetical protein
MTTAAEFQARVTATGNLSTRPVIQNQILPVADDVCRRTLQLHDLWFREDTENLAYSQGTWDSWAALLSRPVSLYYVTAGGGRKTLVQLGRGRFEEKYQYEGATSGSPAHYMMFGPTVRIGPTPDSDLDLIVEGYYQDVALVDTPAGNTWLTYASEWLLFATLAEMSVVNFEDKRIQLWTAKAQAALNALLAEGTRRNDVNKAVKMGGVWQTTTS